ncbi:MAG: DUF933 domain-containing protein [bacterium]
MEAAIVGPPQGGKTAFFALLTGQLYSSLVISHTIHKGVVVYQEPRIVQLNQISPADKITFPQITLFDLPGALGHGEKVAPYPPQMLGELRGMDLLVLVVREFKNPTVPPSLGEINPYKEWEEAELEFIVSDLATIEKRLEKIARQKSPAFKNEVDLLEKGRNVLEGGQPLRSRNWDRESETHLKGFGFLSLKPLLVVINTDEDRVSIVSDNEKEIEGSNTLTSRRKVLRVAVQWEDEVMKFTPEEQREFLAEARLSGSASQRFMTAVFELLDLIVFFTLSPKENTAWAIPRGSTALFAAGTIHKDMASGFIRAEVFPWHELLEFGSPAKLKEKGKVRLEGKDYMVQDGDVLYIRFSH